jgi:hypothetical protein
MFISIKKLRVDWPEWWSMKNIATRKGEIEKPKERVATISSKINMRNAFLLPSLCIKNGAKISKKMLMMEPSAYRKFVLFGPTYLSMVDEFI